MVPTFVCEGANPCWQVTAGWSVPLLMAMGREGANMASTNTRIMVTTGQCDVIGF